MYVSKVIEENAAALERIEKLYMQGLENAKKNYDSAAKAETGEEAADNKKAAEDSGDKYAIRQIEQNEISYEQLSDNIKKTASMESVADIKRTDFAKSNVTLNERVLNFFSEFDNSVYNPVLGDIDINAASIRDSISHGLWKQKANAFAAIPNVLKNGYIVQYKKNWKSRKYDTAVIAAPIKIDGEPYLVGAVVIRNIDNQRFYTHDVEIIKESEPPLKTAAAAINDTLRSDDSPSLKSILLNIISVKRNEAQNQKFSLSDPLNAAFNQDVQDKFEKDVDDVLNGKYTSDDPLMLGTTPTVFRQIGLSALPVVITKNHVYSIAATEAQAKADGRYFKNVNYHGLGAQTVKQIYSKISNPLAIIAAQDITVNPGVYSAHRVVAIVDLSINGNQVIAPVEVDADVFMNNKALDVNLVATYYDKNNIASMLRNAVSSEQSGGVGFYYIDKKRAANLLKPTGVQFPSTLVANNSNGIIHQVDEKVNRKIDTVLKSRQFIRWFGDWQNSPETASKVVNEDGTPKAMYHQTGASFTVFNTNSEAAGKFDSDTPVGMFFKPTEKDIGIPGRKQMKVYLNARNILEFNNRDDIHSYWIKNVEGYSELQKEHDNIDSRFQKEYNEAEEIGDRWYEEHYEDMVSGKITDEEAEKAINGELDKILDRWEKATKPLRRKMKTLITEYIRNSDYDGIHLKYDGSGNGVDVETYIVFSPNQIKSATDNIGTFDGSNPDIRYSLENTSSIDYPSLLKENTDLKKQNEALAAEMKLTEGHKVSRGAVEKLAGKILREYKSGYDRTVLADNLEKVFNYIADENADAAQAMDVLSSVAKAVIEQSSEVDYSLSEQFSKSLR